jgi:GNAT superfamily N-acetyltransferase
MIVRPAITEADFELWTRARNGVEVDSPTTVQDLRDGLSRQPETRHWLAEEDGEPLGCIFVARSSVPGRAFALPRVAPEARRRGIGTALVQAAFGYVRELGCDAVRSHVDGGDAAALRFAARYGFAEVDRQVELVRRLGESERAAVPPAGIALAEHAPERAEELRPLLVTAVEDMPVAGGMDAGYVDQLLDELGDARYLVTAREHGVLVGMAGLGRYGAREDALEHAMTTVARTHRGRGIAQALKQACVHWAAESGYRELVTWTQQGNDPMQAVNERVGFRPGHVSITVEGPVAVPPRPV